WYGNKSWILDSFRAQKQIDSIKSRFNQGLPMKAIRSKAIRIGSMAFVVGIIAAQTRCADDSESKTSPSSCTQSTVPKNYACTTNFALGIPDWIKDNFTCVQVTDDGTNYVFATEDVPSYNS